MLARFEDLNFTIATTARNKRLPLRRGTVISRDRPNKTAIELPAVL